MDITGREIATQYGALDSAAVADGDGFHAHVLRVLAMTSNRLYAMGGPILSLPFSSATDVADTEDDGGLNGFGLWGYWDLIYFAPIIVPKKPTHRTLELQIIAKIQDTETAYLQVATSAAPYRRNARLDAPNVITLTGDNTNAWQNFSLSGIPAGSDDLESISLYMMGEATSTLVATATYGSKNTGTVSDAYPASFKDSTSTWNTSGNTLDDGSVYVSFHDSAGNQVTAPRLITRVVSQTELEFDPPLDLYEAPMISASTYKLQGLMTYRIASITLATEDLT